MAEQCDSNDGGKAFRIQLNDGNTIPVLGYGTSLAMAENEEDAPSEVEYPVTWALEAGYRLINTTAPLMDHYSEDQVGAGVKASSVDREHVFIVTQLPSNEQRDPVAALRKSLSHLDMEYVDLYLISHPVTFKPDLSEYDDIDYLDTWKSMEEAKELGLAKSIGIANFNVSQIERILANCEIKPSVLQVEVNLNLAEEELISFCKENDIVVMADVPFGSLFTEDEDSPAPPPRAEDPELVEIASKYEKTVSQIVLRYLIQRGVVPIPKSDNKDSVEEYVQVFDFELSDEDMDTLSNYNKDYRSVFPSFWQDHPHYPYEQVDVPAEEI